MSTIPILRPISIKFFAYLLCTITYLAFSNTGVLGQNKAPIGIDVTIENIQSSNNTCWLNLKVESLIDAPNTIITLELPESVKGDSALWEGSLMQNNSVSISSRIKFLYKGLFRIGIRVYLTKGAAFHSKLAFIYVENKDGVCTVLKSKPKTNQEELIDIRFEEKIKQNEIGEKAKRLK